MALQIAVITNSIAALSIAGVTIKDKDELKDGWDAFDCPLLCPRPTDFMTGFIEERVSFGSGSTRQANISYVLAYRFFYAPVGTGDFLIIWSAMIDKAFAIVDAIIANDAIAGLIDLSHEDIVQSDVVEDAAGNQFIGCDIPIRVLEFVN